MADSYLDRPTVIVPVRPQASHENFTEWHTIVALPALEVARAALTEKRRQDEANTEVAAIKTIISTLDDVAVLRSLRQMAEILAAGHNVSWRVTKESQ